jgi:hypothetical protein
MLVEGRLTDEDRVRAYGQIERAAARITAISHQASELARWLRPNPSRGVFPIAVPMLLSAAIRDANGAAERVDVTIESGIDWSAVQVPALDRTALTGAIIAVLEAVHREAPAGRIVAAVTMDRTGASCGILVKPVDAPALPPPGDDTDHQTQVALEAAGGMGLALVLAAAIVQAHRGRMIMVPNRRDAIGIDLRLDGKA